MMLFLRNCNWVLMGTDFLYIILYNFETMKAVREQRKGKQEGKGGRSAMEDGKIKKEIDLEAMGQRASAAKYELQRLSAKTKDQVLRAVARQLTDDTEMILQENGKDIRKAEENGMHSGMVDRLRLT